MKIKEFLLTNKFFYGLYKKFKIFKSKKFNLHLGEFGEDIFICRFFRNKNNGVYVDIGCYHPIKGSLTYCLFKKGWNGINVDLSKSSIDLFNIARPHDININSAISNKDGETFYYENGPINQQNSLIQNNDLKKIPIKCYKLSTILKNYNINKVDFLNIDVEGYDYEVISSLNFNEVNPIMICIEQNDFNISKILDNKIHRFLIEKQYFLASKIGVSLIYIQNKYEDKIDEIMDMNSKSFNGLEN